MKNKHIIKKHKYMGITSLVVIIPKNCKCKECRAKAKIEQERKIYLIKNSIELNCDNCNSIIGFVYEGDLEGNYFYCKNCKNGKEVKK